MDDKSRSSERKDANARPLHSGLAFFWPLTQPSPKVKDFGKGKGRGRSNKMKLYFLFVLIDLLVILTYPFVFVFHKLRQLLGFKR
jgi:hypothetical protein